MVVPYNYTLLLIFTICSSLAVSKISLAAQAGNPGVVFEAVALTAAAVLGITIFAFTGFKKMEGVQKISMIGPGLSAIGLVFGVASFFVFAPNDSLGCERDPETDECKPSGLKVMYAVLGVCLFALIMLFDTSSVIGGKSIMFELGPETYILGAV
jgi:FtsH-binding integral membrane protein